MRWSKDLEMFGKQHSWEISKLKGDDVIYYILENFQPHVPATIEWHIENMYLSGVENDYDEGWLHALEMIKRFYTDY